MGTGAARGGCGTAASDAIPEPVLSTHSLLVPCDKRRRWPYDRFPAPGAHPLFTLLRHGCPVAPTVFRCGIGYPAVADAGTAASACCHATWGDRREDER